MDIETPKEFTLKDYIFEIVFGAIVSSATFILFWVCLLFISMIFITSFPGGVTSIVIILLESAFYYWLVFKLTKDGGKSYAHKSALVFVMSGLIIMSFLLIIVISPKSSIIT